jgi:phosphoribosylanthranilate isomerase
MWIKICGNTTLEDARSAAECGADAVGFVFAPSPRQVARSHVRQIVAKLPAKLEKYGVFVDADFDEIVSTVTECGLTGVQLHRTSDARLPFRLQQHFQSELAIISVLHFRDNATEFEQQLTGLQNSQAQNAVLVDSSTSRAVGGTGTRFNWLEARNSFLRAAPKLRLIAAGGLAPENVKQEIETVQPWGVDVVSGVESAPGKKDPERVFAFIRTAQQAAEETTLQQVAKSGAKL